MNPSETIRRELTRRRYSPRTISTYIGCLERFLNWSKKPVNKITKRDVREWIERHKRGSSEDSGRTLGWKWTALNAALVLGFLISDKVTLDQGSHAMASQQTCFVRHVLPLRVLVKGLTLISIVDPELNRLFLIKYWFFLTHIGRGSRFGCICRRKRSDLFYFIHIGLRIGLHRAKRQILNKKFRWTKTTFVVSCRFASYTTAKRHHEKYFPSEINISWHYFWNIVTKLFWAVIASILTLAAIEDDIDTSWAQVGPDLALGVLRGLRGDALSNGKPFYTSHTKWNTLNSDHQNKATEYFHFMSGGPPKHSTTSWCPLLCSPWATACCCPPSSRRASSWCPRAPPAPSLAFSRWWRPKKRCWALSASGACPWARCRTCSSRRWSTTTRSRPSRRCQEQQQQQDNRMCLLMWSDLCDIVWADLSGGWRG